MGVAKQYDENYFKTWTPDMAYILGFLYADGNIVKTKRGGNYVSWYTADKDLLVAMRTCMGSEHAISARRSKTGCVYRMQVGSKEWVKDLGRIGLRPNKTLRMTLPRIPPAVVGDYIRGYFDGDGNVWIGEIHKQRKTSHTTLQVFFTSGCHEYLDSLKCTLRSLGVKGGSLYKLSRGNYSRLILSTRDALTLAEIMYNGQPKLYLNRKKLRFEEFRAKLRW